jgi:hypothetical protein
LHPLCICTTTAPPFFVSSRPLCKSIQPRVFSLSQFPSHHPRTTRCGIGRSAWGNCQRRHTKRESTGTSKQEEDHRTGPVSPVTQTTRSCLVLTCLVLPCHVLDRPFKQSPPTFVSPACFPCLIAPPAQPAIHPISRFDSISILLADTHLPVFSRNSRPRLSLVESPLQSKGLASFDLLTLLLSSTL